jgi:hypothetical protein
VFPTENGNEMAMTRGKRGLFYVVNTLHETAKKKNAFGLYVFDIFCELA